MYLKDTGQEGVDWVCLARDRDERFAVVNRVMNFGFH